MNKDEKAAVAGTQEKAAANKAGAYKKPHVYCGPSVRGVAKQYNVYSGGLPGPLMELMEAHPAARALTVPVEKFAETRRALETPGTAQAVLYAKLKKELEG